MTKQAKFSFIIILRIFFIFVIGLGFPLILSAATYVVLPGEKIQDTINQVRAGDQVWIRAGIYRETVILENDGAAGQEIVIQAYPGDEGKVIISGAEVLSIWREANEAECKGNANWRNIFVAEGVDFEVNQLFQNGTRLRQSRYPDNEGSFMEIDEYVNASTFRDYSVSREDDYWKSARVHLKIQKYAINHYKIAYSSKTLGEIGLAESADELYRASQRFGYFITNAVGEINGPGEWAYNSYENRIYLWPLGNSLEGQTIEADKRETGILSHGDYIVIKGLTIRQTNFLGIPQTAAIFIHGPSFNTIEKCTLEYNLGFAIWTYGGRGQKIINNTIRYAGYRGITSSRPEEAIISENYVYATGTDRQGGDLLSGYYQPQATGIWLEEPRNTSIYHNTVERTGNIGIGIWGNNPGRNNTISYNKVISPMLACGDGGGIYFIPGPNNYDPNNFDYIHHNIVKDTPGFWGGVKNGEGENDAFGIYLDAGYAPKTYNENVIVFKNTVVNSYGSGIFHHSTRNTQTYDNTFYFTNGAQFGSWADENVTMDGNKFHDNILYCGASRFATILEVNAHLENDVVVGNFNRNYYYHLHPNIRTVHVIYGPKGGPTDDPGVYWTFEEWKNNTTLQGSPQDTDSFLITHTGRTIVDSQIFINDTLEDKTITLSSPGLDKGYCDIDGNNVVSFTVQPFESKIALTYEEGIYTLETAANLDVAGTITRDPNRTLYKQDVNVKINAIPNPKWEFGYWEGDIPAGKEKENPVTVIMDSSKTITAVFSYTGTGVTGGLVGYWNFDEGTGNIATDNSGKGNDGTIHGATWTISGKVNKGLNFDGDRDYVDCGSDGSLNFSGPFTISVWINPHSVETRQDVVVRMPVDNSGGYGLRVEGNAIQKDATLLLMYPSGGIYNGMSTTKGIIKEEGKWYHVVAVLDETTVSIYVNKEKDSSLPTPSLTLSESPLFIGAFTNGANGFNGIIDEVKIFNRALTPEEILEEYYAGFRLLSPKNRPQAIIHVPDAVLSYENDFIGADPNTPIEVTFSKEMRPDSFPQGIHITAVYDNEGNKISDELLLLFSYNIAEKSVSISHPQFKKNYTYKIVIDENAKDTDENPAQKIETFLTTPFDHRQKNVIIKLRVPNTQVVLEPYTVSMDGYMLIDSQPLKNQEQSSPNKLDKIREANGKIETITSGHSFPLVETMQDFMLYNSGREYVTPQFNKGATITLPYPDVDNDGLVDGTSVNENGLSIYHLDEKHNLWVRIPGSIVDTKNKTVSVKVSHFSVYVLMRSLEGDLSSAFAFPVPWQPNDGDPKTGGPEGITFANLSSEGTISIYTLTGELVKKINFSGTGDPVIWPGRNENGEPVASGVYIYYIKNGTEHKSGKLIIVK